MDDSVASWFGKMSSSLFWERWNYTD
jgi:hypothetical protein